MKHVRIYLTEKCNASCPWCFNKKIETTKIWTQKSARSSFHIVL